MRANEMAGQEPLSNRSRPFFRVDMHDGFERDATRTLTPRIYKNSAQHSASGAAFHLLTLGPKTGSVLTSFTTYAGPVNQFLILCRVEGISDYLHDILNN
jgi:hypothetical protein